MTNSPYIHYLATLNMEGLHKENIRVNNRMMQATNPGTTAYYRKLRNITESEIAKRHRK